MRAAQRHRLQEQGERPIFRTGDLSVDLFTYGVQGDAGLYTLVAENQGYQDQCNL